MNESVSILALALECQTCVMCSSCIFFAHIALALEEHQRSVFETIRITPEKKVEIAET